MKKIAITVVAIIISVASYAQAGLSLGVNYSAFRNGIERDKGYKPGINAGVYDRIYLGNVVSIQPELRYESKGTLINYDNPLDEQYRLNMGYVTLPVLLNIHLGKTLAISGGYYAGYLVHSNIGKWNYDNTITSFKTDQFHRLDHGYVAGLSFDLHGLILSADASIGNRIVGKDGGPFGRGDVTPAYNHVYKNAAANVSIKYPFRVRK